MADSAFGHLEADELRKGLLGDEVVIRAGKLQRFGQIIHPLFDLAYGVLFHKMPFPKLPARWLQVLDSRRLLAMHFSIVPPLNKVQTS